MKNYSVINSKLLLEFESLLAILKNENEDSWINGINLIVRSLRNPDRNSESVFQYVRDTYISMAAGVNGFSDFHVWRENSEDRFIENQKLSEIKENIYRMIDSHS